MIQQRSSFSLFLQEAIVSSSGTGRDVCSLMLSIQHFLCRPRRRTPLKAPWRLILERLTWRVTCLNHANEPLTKTSFSATCSTCTCTWWLFPWEVFGRRLDHWSLACAFFFFFLVEISSRTLIPRFRPGSVHSGSASGDDCGRVFPDDLRVSLFPMLGKRHSQPTPNSVFRCNLPPALFAEWPGSFTCHCGNTGVERTPNKSQHTKLTLQKKILPPLLPGFELATFRSRV